MKYKIVGGVTAVVVLAVAGGLIFTALHRSAIPADIKKQLDFAVLYPTGNQDIIVKRDSFKYDQQSKVLSFIVTAYKTEATVTEQSTPDSFNDIPGYYDKVVAQLNGYGTFDSVIGKVSLTHPKDLNGDQTAVLNAKGVLMFVHPKAGLQDDQWHKFINSLEVVK